MILAVVLVVGACLVGVVAPTALSRVPHRVTGPEVVVSAWFASMAVFFFFSLSAVVVAGWPGHAPAEGIMELALRCLSQVQHTAGGPGRDPIIALALLVLVLLGVRGVRLARGQLGARSATTDRHRDAFDGIARREDAAVTTLWLDHPAPLAYSVPGRPGFIVATEGLRTHLTPGELAAVLAHERAHLQHRHHTMVAACDVLSRVLPVVPLFRRAPAVVRTQVELSADRTAVRATDPATVRAALSKVAGLGVAVPAGSLPQPDPALDLRVEQLETKGWGRRGRGRTVPGCAGAAMLALVAPAVVALALVGASSAAACVLP